MREPWNKNATLWGGYVVARPDGTVYHSGDTAWGDHFAEIGKRFPIDWAMLPIGAYSPRWFMKHAARRTEEAARGFEALGATQLARDALGHVPAHRRSDRRTAARACARTGDEHGLDPRLWIVDVGESRPLLR